MEAYNKYMDKITVSNTLHEKIMSRTESRPKRWPIMIKRYTAAFACLVVVLLGVFIIPKLTQHNVTPTPDDITEAENLSPVVRSVQDLQLAIEDSVTGKISDIKVDPAIDLASIDYFYVPTVKFDNHQLFQIEVLENYIIYYYIPDDVMEGSQPVFDYNTGITATFSRKPDKNDPLAPLVKQAGIPLTEDNILYEKNLNSVTFAVGDTWMSIRVPDELNDYNYLKNLGLAEKVHVIN